MTEPKFDKSSTVQIGKIFLFSEGSITAIAHGGSFEVNAAILSTAMPRQRVDTVEVLSDGPSAVVSGIEHGAASASVGISSATLIAGRIVSAATVVGGFNDAINVGQHVVQGNGAETVTEGLGVAGQASGAAAGAKAFGTAGSALGGPFVGAIGALVGGGFGAFVGAQGAKSLGAYLTGGDTPDKLGPPLTLPNDTALTPAVTTSDGSQYALVQIEGKYTWFSIQDNPALPSRYVEVVSGARAAELTGSYLQAAGFESQLAQARAEVVQQQREALRDAFARSEIQSANDMGPNGLLWGTPSAIGPNATQAWARSHEPGQALNILDVRNADGSASRIVQEVDKSSGVLLGDKTYENPEASNPDGFRLVATSDYQSGVHWTLNRETGVMEQAGIAPAKAGAPSVEDGFAPDGSPLGQAATVIHEGRARTTVWARDAATGHYTETETITRRDGAGNVMRSATAVRSYAADGTELQSAAPRELAQGHLLDEATVQKQPAPEVQPRPQPIAPARPMDPRDAGHPDHAMNEGVRSRLQALNAEEGIRMAPEAFDNATAALMSSAREARMTQVTHMYFGMHDDGRIEPSRVILYQGEPTQAASRYKAIDLGQATAIPAEQSYQRAEQTQQQQLAQDQSWRQQQAALEQQAQGMGMSRGQG